MNRLLLSVVFLAVAVLAMAAGGSRYATEGMDYFRRGDYPNAIAQFKAADRAANGKVAEYHFILGQIYCAVPDTAEARQWMRRYLRSEDRKYRGSAEAVLAVLAGQSSIFGSVNVRPLPPYFQSRGSDFGPVVDPSGRYLYFSSVRPDRFAKENIWRAELFGSGFGKPEPVHGLGTDRNEALGSFSADGSSAWLFGNYDSRTLDGDIYRLELSSAGVSLENAAFLNSPQVDTHPMLFGNDVIFFTSSRAGGYGGMDLYVCERIGGIWGEPVNLGPAINTAKNEQTPFLDYDGRTLYFASNGHPGLGGYDIFRVYRTGSGWDAWSIPQNLGVPVNSPFNDRFFYHAQASNEGFFSSDRGSGEFEKIYRLNFLLSYPQTYLASDAAGRLSYVEIPDSAVAPGSSSLALMADNLVDLNNLGRVSGQAAAALTPSKQPRTPWQAVQETPVLVVDATDPAATQAETPPQVTEEPGSAAPPEVTPPTEPEVTVETVSPRTEDGFQLPDVTIARAKIPELIAAGRPLQTVVTPAPEPELPEPEIILAETDLAPTPSAITDEPTLPKPGQAEVAVISQPLQGLVTTPQTAPSSVSAIPAAESVQPEPPETAQSTAEPAAEPEPEIIVAAVAPPLIEDKPLVTKPQQVVQPRSNVGISGIIRDGDNNPVTADIELVGLVDGERIRGIVSTDSQGNFKTVLPRTSSYNVVVNKEGYLLYSENFSIYKSAESVNLKIVLLKLDKKKGFVFDSVPFDIQSNSIRSRTFPMLNNLVITLLNNPDLRLNVSGHADDLATPADNQKLSESRARAVAEYLSSKGIDVKRLNLKGFGATRAQLDPAKNRRVDIELVVE